MKLSLLLISRRGLTLAIGTALSVCAVSASAGEVEGSGKSATVEKGAVAEDWKVLDGATLNVNAGGRTGTVYASIYSHLNMAGAAADRSFSSGISLYNASSAIVKHADIVSGVASGAGLFLGQIAADDGKQGSAVALFEDSLLQGDAAGAHVTAAGELTARRTHVVGAGMAGHGILLANGKVDLAEGTQVTGSANGIRVEKASDIDKENGRWLVVDASRVEGLGGAAIAVPARRALAVTRPSSCATARRWADATMSPSMSMAIVMRQCPSKIARSSAMSSRRWVVAPI